MNHVITNSPESAQGSSKAAQQEGEVHDLKELLQRIESVADRQDKVSLGNVMDEVGSQSFVPLLILPGLVMLAPGIGDIPGIPVLMGTIVILVAGQLMLQRDHLWLPGWLENWRVSSSKVKKAIGWMRPPARFMDRWSKQRYTKIVNHAGVSVIAVTCIVIAMATPAMEVVPLTANFAGAAITAFGLALLARDGLIALGAIAFSAAVAGLLILNFAS